MYIRFPSEFTDAEKVQIRNAIRQNREFQLLAVWYREFYKTFDQIDRDLKKTPPADFVITLSPLQKSAVSKSDSIPSAVSFESSKSAGLKTLKTFFSEAHETLLIALKGKNNKHSQLHVISGYINEDDILLLKTGNQKKRILVSEPGGIFKIDEEDIPSGQIAEWPSFKLYLPVTSIKVFKDPSTGSVTFDTIANNRQNTNVQFEVEDSSLYVTVDTPNQAAPEKLVICSGKTKTLMPITGGRCTLDLESLEETSSVLIFFL